MAKLKAGDPSFPDQVRRFVDRFNTLWINHSFPSIGQGHIKDLQSSPYLPYVEGVAPPHRRNFTINLKEDNYDRLRYTLLCLKVKGG